MMVRTPPRHYQQVAHSARGVDKCHQSWPPARLDPAWLSPGTAAGGAFAFEHGLATASSRQVPCFALDIRVVMLPGWDQDGGTVIMESPS